jgi:hypothetical protein
VRLQQIQAQATREATATQTHPNLRNTSAAAAQNCGVGAGSNRAESKTVSSSPPSQESLSPVPQGNGQISLDVYNMDDGCNNNKTTGGYAVVITATATATAKPHVHDVGHGSGVHVQSSAEVARGQEAVHVDGRHDEHVGFDHGSAEVRIPHACMRAVMLPTCSL